MAQLEKIKVVYDYTDGLGDYVETLWINKISGEKELIKLPALKDGEVWDNVPYHNPPFVLLELE